MLFNSFHYFLFFAVVLLAVDAVRRRRLQHALLLGASFYFYWVSSGGYLLLLVFSSFLDFYCGRALRRSARPRFYLFLSLAGNLGVLAYFKYAGFAVSTVASGLQSLGWQADLGSLQIFLPIGISFFTFQSLSYTLDIYFRKLEPVDSFREFALYVAFFPQLVAGPIIRARDFLPQLGRAVVLNWSNLQLGMTLILYGLIKKICVADNLAGFVEQTFQGEPSRDSLVIAVGAVAFAVQIYCDFSGYTDIAIGSARILGFHFADNFAHPYFATSITEFWRRWHISLSTWLRDYLYIPLGGNRRGKPRQVFNLMVTMLLGGLWHGAAWHFVWWGGYQGLLLAAHKFLIADLRFLSHRFWKPLKMAATFYLVCLGWLLFIVAEPSRLLYFVGKFLGLDFQTAGMAALWNERPLEIILLGGFFLVHALSYRAGTLAGVFSSLRPPVWAAGAAGSLVLLYLLAAGQQSFIYFQF